MYPSGSRTSSHKAPAGAPQVRVLGSAGGRPGAERGAPTGGAVDVDETGEAAEEGRRRAVGGRPHPPEPPPRAAPTTGRGLAREAGPEPATDAADTRPPPVAPKPSWHDDLCALVTSRAPGAEPLVEAVVSDRASPEVWWRLLRELEGSATASELERAYGWATRASGEGETGAAGATARLSLGVGLARATWRRHGASEGRDAFKALRRVSGNRAALFVEWANAEATDCAEGRVDPASLGPALAVLSKGQRDGAQPSADLEVAEAALRHGAAAKGLWSWGTGGGGVGTGRWAEVGAGPAVGARPAAGAASAAKPPPSKPSAAKLCASNHTTGVLAPTTAPLDAPGYAPGAASTPTVAGFRLPPFAADHTSGGGAAGGISDDETVVCGAGRSTSGAGGATYLASVSGSRLARTTESGAAPCSARPGGGGEDTVVVSGRAGGAAAARAAWGAVSHEPPAVAAGAGLTLRSKRLGALGRAVRVAPGTLGKVEETGGLPSSGAQAGSGVPQAPTGAGREGEHGACLRPSSGLEPWERGRDGAKDLAAPAPPAAPPSPGLTSPTERASSPRTTSASAWEDGDEGGGAAPGAGGGPDSGRDEDETAPVVMSRLASRIKGGRQSLAPQRACLDLDEELSELLLGEARRAPPAARPAAPPRPRGVSFAPDSKEVSGSLREAGAATRRQDREEVYAEESDPAGAEAGGPGETVAAATTPTPPRSAPSEGAGTGSRAGAAPASEPGVAPTVPGAAPPPAAGSAAGSAPSVGPAAGSAPVLGPTPGSAPRSGPSLVPTSLATAAGAPLEGHGEPQAPEAPRAGASAPPPPVPPRPSGRRVIEDERTVTVRGVTYQKLECIGRGGSSRVYKVLAPNRRIFALKRIRLAGRDPEAAAGFADEIALLTHLREAPNIVTLVDSEVHAPQGMIYMVLEYGDIDLARLLVRHDAQRAAWARDHPTGSDAGDGGTATQTQTADATAAAAAGATATATATVTAGSQGSAGQATGRVIQGARARRGGDAGAGARPGSPRPDAAAAAAAPLPPDENFIRLQWEQMLRAVAVIHQARIVHSDLKPANFLVVEGELKLIDFGIAKAIGADTTSIARESQVGTLNYMSPEAILGGRPAPGGGPAHRVGRASDVWSLGCILYQMAHGRTPFAHLPFIQKMHAITDPRHRVEFPPLDDPDLDDSIRRCLDRNPKTRITIPQLLAHPFLRPGRAALGRADAAGQAPGAPRPAPPGEKALEAVAASLLRLGASRAALAGADLSRLAALLARDVARALDADPGAAAESDRVLDALLSAADAALAERGAAGLGRAGPAPLAAAASAAAVTAWGGPGAEPGADGSADDAGDDDALTADLPETARPQAPAAGHLTGGISSRPREGGEAAAPPPPPGRADCETPTVVLKRRRPAGAESAAEETPRPRAAVPGTEAGRRLATPNLSALASAPPPSPLASPRVSIRPRKRAALPEPSLSAALAGAPRALAVSQEALAAGAAALRRVDQNARVVRPPSPGGLGAAMRKGMSRFRLDDSTAGLDEEYEN